MNVTCREHNKNLIVGIDGEIDHHTADALKDKIERAFAKESARNIVFDFQNVTFMDSSGIGMIIGRYKSVEAKGGKVYAINIGGRLTRIFEISGLKKIIGCYDSLDEAERFHEA